MCCKSTIRLVIYAFVFVLWMFIFRFCFMCVMMPGILKASVRTELGFCEFFLLSSAVFVCVWIFMYFVSFVQPCRCLLWKTSVLFALCFMLSVLNLVLVCSVMPKYFRDAVFRSCWEWIEYGNYMDV